MNAHVVALKMGNVLVMKKNVIADARTMVNAAVDAVAMKKKNVNVSRKKEYSFFFIV